MSLIGFIVAKKSKIRRTARLKHLFEFVGKLFENYEMLKRQLELRWWRDSKTVQSFLLEINQKMKEKSWNGKQLSGTITYGCRRLKTETSHNQRVKKTQKNKLWWEACKNACMLSAQECTHTYLSVQVGLQGFGFIQQRHAALPSGVGRGRGGKSK